MSTRADNVAYLGYSFEPSGNSGHGFAETSIENKSEWENEGGEDGNISESEALSNEECFSGQVSVEHLHLLFDYLACFVERANIISKTKSIVCNLAGVGPQSGQSNKLPLLDLSFLESAFAEEFGGVGLSSDELGDSVALKNASAVLELNHGELSMGLLGFEVSRSLLLFGNNNSFNGNIGGIGSDAGVEEVEMVESVGVKFHLGSYIIEIIQTKRIRHF